MEKSLFQRLYCEKIFNVESIRTKPIQASELISFAGMNEATVRKYLGLVKELYKECLIYNSTNPILQIPNEYGKRQIVLLFLDYLEFCFLNCLISKEDYLFFRTSERNLQNREVFFSKLLIFSGSAVKKQTLLKLNLSTTFV